jgi:hypothetical protein
MLVLSLHYSVAGGGSPRAKGHDATFEMQTVVGRVTGTYNSLEALTACLTLRRLVGIKWGAQGSWDTPHSVLRGVLR